MIVGVQSLHLTNPRRACTHPVSSSLQHTDTIKIGTFPIGRSHRDRDTRTGLRPEVASFLSYPTSLSLVALSQSLRYDSIPFRCLLISRLCYSFETPFRLSSYACFSGPINLFSWIRYFETRGQILGIYWVPIVFALIWLDSDTVKIRSSKFPGFIQVVCVPLYLLWVLFCLKNTFNCKCNEFVQLLFVSKIIHQNQFQTEKC